MELHLENQEASLAFKILRNRANELDREIEQNKNAANYEYTRHKAIILKNLLLKFSDVDEKAYMRGYKVQEI